MAGGHTVNEQPGTGDPSAPLVGGFRGHDVVDEAHRLIGTISDVVDDDLGDPRWAVVDLGMLRASHDVPVAAGHTSQNGEFVVPFDEQVVKAAPKADRDRHVDEVTERAVVRHDGEI